MGRIDALLEAVNALGEVQNKKAPPSWPEGNLVIEDRAKAVLESMRAGGYRPQFIYLDPPFYTKKAHRHPINVSTVDGEVTFEPAAYEDRWTDFAQYLRSVAEVLQAAHEALAEDGVIALHVDFRSVGYFHLLLDHIFGPRQLINEIIWQYKSGGASKKSFARKHDNVLIYGKGATYIFHPQVEKSYNRGGKPYRFKGVKEYEDEGGWYTLVHRRDVWEIPMVGRTSKERTGYPTQKPEILLRRLITAFTNEGDLVFDGYGGSGTTAAVAAKTKRRFITADQSPLAIHAMERRLGEWSPEFIRKVPQCVSCIDREGSIPVMEQVPVDVKALALSAAEEEVLHSLMRRDPYCLLARLSYVQENGAVMTAEGPMAVSLARGMSGLCNNSHVVVQNVFGQRFIDERKEDDHARTWKSECCDSTFDGT